MTAFVVYNDTVKQTGTELNTVNVKGVVHFGTESNEKVRVKVGISPVSSKNAFDNIAAEIHHWDFKNVSENAYDRWNQQLKKIDIRSADSTKLKNLLLKLLMIFLSQTLKSPQHF